MRGPVIKYSLLVRCFVGEMISIICKCRLSTTKKDNKKNKTLISGWCQKDFKSSKHIRCLFLRAGHDKLIANPMVNGKVQDEMANCSWYTHNHIRHVISFHIGHFRVKLGLIRWIVKFCFVFAAKTHAVSLRSDQLVKVFSFKVRSAWLDRLENYILGCTRI